MFGHLRHDSIGYWWLVERYRRMGYDAHAIAERYDEHVEDVLVNVVYALSLRALSRLDAEDSQKWAARACQTEAALLERCYDEATGLFFDLAGRTERRVAVSTWSSLSPLALDALPRTSAGGSSRSTSCTPGDIWPRAASRRWRCPSRRSTRGSRCGAAGAVRRG